MPAIPPDPDNSVFYFLLCQELRRRRQPWLPEGENTMEKTHKYVECIKVNVVTRWLTITVDGIGHTTALSVIGSLTLLFALYMYFAFTG